MDLEKRISRGVEKEHYFIVLGCQTDDRKTFEKEYITKPFDEFKNPDKEEEVLAFYKSCDHKLPIGKDGIREVMKHDGKYWCMGHGENVWNHNTTRMIKVQVVRNINLQERIPQAIRNLTKYVKGDLSLGDRQFLREIAKETFLRALDLAADNSGENYTLSMCLRMYDNEFTHMRLRQYGFDLKEPHGLYTDYQRITKP